MQRQLSSPAPTPGRRPSRDAVRRLASPLAAATALLFAAALPAAASTPAPAAAPASTAVVQCAGTEAITYTPGLTTVPQQVRLSAQGTLGPCATTAGPDFSDGRIAFSGAGQLSCTVGGSSSGTAAITWTGGERSAFTYQGAVSLRPDGVTVLVLTGTVTSGSFAGEHVVNTITLASTDLTACLSSRGLTATSGPITLNVNPLI